MHKILGFMTTIIFIGVVGSFLVSSVYAEGGYSFLRAWGTYGTGNGQFNNQEGIAVDNEGNVYVADKYNNRIQKFGPNGTFITNWGTSGSGNGQFSEAHGIAIDSSGNVYVSDLENNRIQKFGPTGTFITTWGTPGSGNGQFMWPAGMAIDSSGNVYVSEMGNDRIQKFSPDGTFDTKWGTPGSGNRQFDMPTGVAIDNSDNVYVADWNNSRIQVFGPTGTFITKWGTSGSGNGQFNWPAGMAIDNSGNVYVVDCGNNRIQKFGPNGAFITKWGTPGSGNGQFTTPVGIAVNSSRDVYVADTENNRIQVFSPDRFPDTPLDYWATSYIEVIYQAGYTTGYRDGRYGPEDNVKREEMAAFIIRAVEGEPPLNYCDSGSLFPDVTSDMWSCRYIKRLKELEITTGYKDGTYGPNNNVSREEMATFLVRAVEGEPTLNYCDSGSLFPDVTPDMWSCRYIKRLKELEITTGYQDGTYGPYDLVTRAQMAAFLARAFLEME